MTTALTVILALYLGTRFMVAFGRALLDWVRLSRGLYYAIRHAIARYRYLRTG